MRLWSLHPKYLDTKGLVALWRDGLYALSIIETNNYSKHSQLKRFNKHTLQIFLEVVYQEAVKRDFKFNSDKIEHIKLTDDDILSVSLGQLEYEMNCLLRKLYLRDCKKYFEVCKSLESNSRVLPHPIFAKVDLNYEIEIWENFGGKYA